MVNMRRLLLPLFFIFGLALVGYACLHTSRPEAEGVISVAEGPLPDYETVKARIAAQRDSLSDLFGASRGDRQEEVLQASGKALRSAILNDIVPQWYGTTWDFNGTTRVPRQGSIACGYFITTVLQDAGLNLDRSGIAQKASSEIIKILCEPSSYEWISGKSREEFLLYMKTKPEGIYIVGLDNHVGFMHHLATGDRFIHASYKTPVCVVNEKAASSEVLDVSRIYVIGRLSPQRELVKKWLRKERI